jgi:hypothetical protein
MAQLADLPSGLTEDTELLLYFVGHSVSAGENDIKLILGTDANDENRLYSLRLLLETIRDQTPIRKLVMVLDTCHCGRTRDVFRAIQINTFVMYATGSEYAFEANFSDNLLKTLEQPIRKNDQRIDRRVGGITYRKVFEDAQRRLLSDITASGYTQNPQCIGDYGSQILFQVPVEIPDAINEFASKRSIYGRLHCILDFVDRAKPTENELRSMMRQSDQFLLRRGETEANNQFVSARRLSEYLAFMEKAKWIVQPRERYQTTDTGKRACDEAIFNRALLDAIQREVFSDGIDFAFLDEVVKGLLEDMIPPTPAKIKERTAMKGKVLELDDATRIAIQILPSTGQFMKGSADAIFPSDFNGAASRED